MRTLLYVRMTSHFCALTLRLLCSIFMVLSLNSSDVVMVICNCNQLQLFTFFDVILVIGLLKHNVVGNRN